MAETLERQIRDVLNGKGISTSVQLRSRRPPMKERRASRVLAESFEKLASKWEIQLKRESSVWPSVGGLVPPKTGVVCGMGPVARDIYTPDESVDRISLIQRTILLAEFLNEQA